MDRITVVSSNISEVGHDETTGTLEILFTSGSLYQFFDVPAAVYEQILTASSVGQYFNSNIKGNFRYAKV